MEDNPSTPTADEDITSPEIPIAPTAFPTVLPQPALTMTPGEVTILQGLVDTLRSMTALFGAFLRMPQAQMMGHPSIPTPSPIVQGVPCAPLTVGAPPAVVPTQADRIPEAVPVVGQVFLSTPSATLPGGSTQVLEQMPHTSRAILTLDSSMFTQSVRPLAQWIRDAKEIGCVTFAGSTDPLKARAWINDVRRITTEMRLADEDKLSVAIFLLRGDAKIWWFELEARTTTNISWTQFLEVFDRQFYTPRQHFKIIQEFLDCSQHGRPAVEYASEFNRLASFVPEMILSEKYRCTRFIRGLDFMIREKVALLDFSDFQETVEKTIIAEEFTLEETTLELQEQNDSQKRKRKRSGRRAVTCYHCGQVGHTRPSCPELQLAGVSHPSMK